MSVREVLTEALFLPGVPGERMCIRFRPAGSTPAYGVVLVPPFAEEMNKSRRMLALQARQVARTGGCAVLPDLFGTGDSSGDFADARWDVWQADLSVAVAAVRDVCDGPISLLGLRLGALLAAEHVHRAQDRIDKLVLWHPVTAGEQFLTQFLRISLASDMVVAGERKNSVSQMRDRAKAGDTLEVGGYGLAPDLFSAIDGLRLGEFLPGNASVSWFQVVSGETEGGVPPVVSRVLDRWTEGGVRATYEAIVGDPFWGTVEIAECPALLQRTTAVLSGAA